MEHLKHSLPELFEQLGLPANDVAIDRFIKKHSLANFEQLPDAGFWNDSQRQFLIEAKLQDADWVGVVDLLDTALRKN